MLDGLERAIEVNTVVSSNINRLTTTNDGANMQGNDTNPHSAANEHMEGGGGGQDKVDLTYPRLLYLSGSNVVPDNSGSLEEMRQGQRDRGWFGDLGAASVSFRR